MNITDLSNKDQEAFFKWLDTLNAHAVKLGLVTRQNQNYSVCQLNDLENCSWFNYWQDGETPEDAIALDLSYA